jgi:eukaryotic-like serine/threonine-protein kinase
VSDRRPEPKPRAERIADAIADGAPLDGEVDATLTGLDPAIADAFRVLSALRGQATPLSPREKPADLEQGYDLLSELGHGSFGVVWLARDRALHREVALKIVRDDRFGGGEARDRFLREARILAMIEHPNIVRIHSIDEAEGRLRLALERIDGQTFDRVMRASGRLPADQVARVGFDLCSALAVIHDQGLVHGDLKPSNVMRSREGRTVLLDFGIARDPAADATPDGAAIPQGTPLFMAPEVFDRRVPDARSDLFALGAMLFQLLTGTLPFPGSDPVTIRAMQTDPEKLAPRLDHVPPVLRRIVLDCLAEQRDSRPADARVVARRLREFLTIGVRRRRLWIGLVAAALICAATLLGMRSARRGVVAADFLRLGDGKEQRLRDGDHVVEGDRIVFDLELDRAMHVYAFNEDDQGAIAALYPIPGVETGREIAAGKLRLPGTIGGIQQEWILGAGGAAEYFVVLAAPHAIEAAERFERTVLTPEVDPRLIADAGDVRGVGEVRAMAAEGRSAAPSFAGTRLAELLAACEDDDAIVVRKLALRRK